MVESWPRGDRVPEAKLRFAKVTAKIEGGWPDVAVEKACLPG